MYNFFSNSYNRNIFFINSQEAGFVSTVSLWPILGFYEREASELFGIYFSNKNDSRNLLLDYGNTSFPMGISSPVGKVELRYTKFSDRPKTLPNTISFV